MRIGLTIAFRLDESAGTAPWPARFSLENSWTSWPNDMTSMVGQNGLDIKIYKLNLLCWLFHLLEMDPIHIFQTCCHAPRLLKSSEQCSPFYMPQEETKCGTWPKDMPHLTPGLEHGFVVGFLVLDVCGSVGVLDDMLASYSVSLSVHVVVHSDWTQVLG